MYLVSIHNVFKVSIKNTNNNWKSYDVHPGGTRWFKSWYLKIKTLGKVMGNLPDSNTKRWVSLVFVVVPHMISTVIVSCCLSQEVRSELILDPGSLNEIVIH